MRYWMRTQWRIALAGLLLSVPLLLLAGFAAWFWLAEVPKFTARERTRAKREYKARAAELATNSTAIVVARAKSWHQASKIDGVPWGYVAEGGFVRVWRGKGPAVRSVLVEPEGTDIEFFFGAFIVLTLAFVCLLTALGFRFFVRFECERRDFVAAAAHDLETPVAALGLVLENRAAGVGTDAEAFAECERLALRLGRLVDNLRDFIHRGRRGAPVLSEFDIVESVRAAYRPFAADYRELLGADVPISGEAHCRVRADETLTAQILWNLFANDLKYAAPYGGVAVSIVHADDRIRVSFSDEGRGLTDRERRRIFERYYRAQSTSTSGKGGFGIGLCSAREFARAMGGDLTVRANVPHGCVFDLEFPAGSTH